VLSTIGYASIIAALLAALIMAVAGYRAGFARSGLAAGTSGQAAADIARRASYFCFAAMTVAIGTMELALLTHDFSVDYVARVGSRETPAYYTAISLWSSLDGSILFWGWILAGYGALVAFVRRRTAGDRQTPLFSAVFGTVGLFFFGLLIGPANPFGLVDPAPLNGPGPNPLLQNHPLMGIHPPMLYLGFVGLTVPFAFAIAALLSGNLESKWLRDARRWTIAGWAFLTMGIIGGGWWSYEVLGWGGYWAWDPVENASFLPWLTATAFLHSAMVQERRGMLKTWNLTLIISTFLLTLLGTFLTRSGILESVHAFTEGLIGPLFLGFIALTALASLGLIAWRSDRLHAPGQLDGVVSRESAFILNNLLFVAFTFTVLLGTMFPLIVEAVRDQRISVGPPYFDMVASPIGLALLFLMGVGAVLPWRRTTGEQLKRVFRWPILVGIVAPLVALALGVRKPYPLITLALAGFVATTIVEEFRRGLVARRRISGRSHLVAFFDLFARNGRRYGGYVVHTGVVLIALALSISGTWKTEREATLRPGERLQIEEYEIEFTELFGREESQRYVVGATFTTYRNGREMGEEHPRLNFYRSSQQPIASPAVASSLTKDLYLTLMAFDQEENHATVRVIVNPAVAWLWIGGGVMGLGALIAVWPRRRTAVQTSGESLLVAALGSDGGAPTVPEATGSIELEGVATEGVEVTAEVGES
jgi:cytochrome c-type biogenesis protein CcmF